MVFWNFYFWSFLNDAQHEMPRFLCCYCWIWQFFLWSHPATLNSSSWSVTPSPRFRPPSEHLKILSHSILLLKAPSCSFGRDLFGLSTASFVLLVLKMLGSHHAHALFSPSLSGLFKLLLSCDCIGLLVKDFVQSSWETQASNMRFWSISDSWFS